MKIFKNLKLHKNLNISRHVVTAHHKHLQLVTNLLKMFETPLSVFVQLG